MTTVPVSEITLTIGVDPRGRVVGLLAHTPPMEDDELDTLLKNLALMILGIPTNGAAGPVLIDIRAAYQIH